MAEPRRMGNLTNATAVTGILTGIPFSVSATSALIAISVILILFGILGNVLIIVSVVVDRNLRIRCNVFLIILALADFTILGYTLPFSVLDFLWNRYPVGIKVCRFNAFVLNYCVGVSHWCLAAIAIDRYIRICHSVRYNVWMSKRHTALAVIIVFLLPAPINVSPFLGFGQTGYHEQLHMCSYFKRQFMYIIFQVLTIVFSPVVIIVTLYLKIFLHVRSVGRTVHANNPSESVIPTYRRQDVSLARMLFVVFVALMVLMMPSTIGAAADFGGRPYWFHNVELGSLYLLYTNNCINWIIYGLMNTNFRNAYKQVLCKCINNRQ